jgi:mannosyl-3-phosphoglycerate phosphatase family protein
MKAPVLTAHCRSLSGLLVFSDLDGTLLDHHDYSYTAAMPALKLLSEAEVPLILTSSKTRSEIQALTGELGLDFPYIVENGAGIIIPDGYFATVDAELPLDDGARLKYFGPPLAGILETLHRLREQSGVRFTGFSEMDDDQVMQRTGLSRQAAGQARSRYFSEPLAWEDSAEAWARFSRLLNGAGLFTLRGGRFIHVMASGDKGAALMWLRNMYMQDHDMRVCTLALGDSDNDSAMLTRADIGIVVRSPVHQPPASALEAGCPVTDLEGPEGWNQAILLIAETMADKQEQSRNE